MSDLEAETRRDIERFVSEWVGDQNVPGASVAVVDTDGLAYAEGFGARDRAANAPATPDTLYGIGSCTKSFTAVALMQLAEAGDLAISDPVDDYLPHLRDVPGDPVTLHELLCHSSGMPSDGNLSALVTRLTDRGEGDSGLPITGDDDFRRHVETSADERLTDRERFFYYNTGYTLLGKVIEEVSGQSFAEYVAENVHAPLGMDRSCFSREAFEADDDRMTGYNLEDAGDDEDGTGDGGDSATEAVEADLALDELTYAPGGMLSSVAEMANYVGMYLGEGSFEGERLLSPDSVSRMTERHATRDDYLDERAQGYGYGLSATEFLNDTLVGHGGMMGTTTAWFGYLEDAGVGVVVACNTAPEKHPSVVGKAVLALAEGADPHATVPTYALDRKAEPLVGKYTSHREVRTATVEQSGSGLTITADDPGWSAEYRVFPESLDPDDHSYYTVTARGKRVPVEFVVTDDDVSLLLQRWRLHKE
ncbi:serine hydrolase [Halorussus amylolyticus]|uniref:serine hydrolase n=1 Tax=Halorussus amylolyticus TaxID=1126242 RepID=UPI00104AD13D|nr:serine hydrolase [Halorussus amylolyticus]